MTSKNEKYLERILESEQSGPILHFSRNGVILGDILKDIEGAGIVIKGNSVEIKTHAMVNLYFNSICSKAAGMMQASGLNLENFMTMLIKSLIASQDKIHLMTSNPANNAKENRGALN